MSAEQNRIVALLFLLGAAGAIWYWSTTTGGQTAIGNTVDNLNAVLSGTSRGIRNNNPGNIVRNNIQWQGALTEAQVQALGWTWDPTFVQFDTPLNGLRALGRILLVYASRGDNSVDALISTYAPPAENDTAAYELAVANAIGVNEGATINVPQELGQIMAAVVQHENQQPGTQWVDPYGQSLYVEAIAAASQNS